MFEIIEEDTISEVDDLAIRKFLASVFKDDEEIFLKSRHWHGSAPTYSIVAKSHDALCGHIGIVVRTLRAGEAQVTVAGVQNLGVPREFAGKGIGHHLLDDAMQEADQRGIKFGFLFCVPRLEKYYQRNGWVTVPGVPTMNLDGGPDEPIPGKNITMVRPLTSETFPSGPIHLQGPDW